MKWRRRSRQEAEKRRGSFGGFLKEFAWVIIIIVRTALYHRNQSIATKCGVLMVDQVLISLNLGYCSKPNSQLSRESNQAIFLWVIVRQKPRGGLGKLRLLM